MVLELSRHQKRHYEWQLIISDYLWSYSDDIHVITARKSDQFFFIDSLKMCRFTNIFHNEQCFLQDYKS